MTGEEPYSYARSVKSDASDELINRYLIRPLAGLVVQVCYPTRVSPNQLTIAAIVAGFCSAAAYFPGNDALTPLAGVLLLCKDILDSADGQLARARNQFSRLGRFLDSIGDLAVNTLVFLAIGIGLGRHGGVLLWITWAIAAFLCLTLRVSYHVFYQTSFLHLGRSYEGNRITEEVRPDDLLEDPWTLRLQRWFQVLYGWQDRLMVRIDRWSKGGLTITDEPWYGDRPGIRWSGFLGLGTENMTLALFSFFAALPAYLAFNLVVANAVMLGSVLYRRVLARRLGRG